MLLTVIKEVAGNTFIPEPGSLVGGAAAVPRGQGGATAPDLLGGGLDQLLAEESLGTIGMGGGAAPTGYVPPNPV